VSRVSCKTLSSERIGEDIPDKDFFIGNVIRNISDAEFIAERHSSEMN